MSNYFSVRGKSHSEVQQKIYEQYGTRAKIMSSREVQEDGFLGLFPRKMIELSGFLADENSRSHSGPVERTAQIQRQRDLSEKSKILNNFKDDEPEKNEESALSKIEKELKDIKKQISVSTAPVKEDSAHHALKDIEDWLDDNDFTNKFIRQTLARFTSELTLEELEQKDIVWNKLSQIIDDSIEIFDHGSRRFPRVVALVGPTGVGKTTTIAKLAAMYGVLGVNGIKHSVKIITIDGYRVGARYQIETYGDYMGIPVYYADNEEELKKCVDSNRDSDLILVDTIGKSPKDYMKLATVRKILTGCGKDSEIHLVMSASTKSSDMKEIMKQFAMFDYKSVVISKMDETSLVGGIISVLNEEEKTISYITDGQGVPNDIGIADRKKMTEKLIKVENFTI